VITLKRYETGCKLVLITNSKSHMGFGLVPKSDTLNGIWVIALTVHYSLYLSGRLHHSGWI